MAPDNSVPDSTTLSPSGSFFRFAREQWRGRLARNLVGAIFWQLLAKLLQLAGVAYAARCLGAASLGLSGTVMVAATQLQMLLDFGLDFVAIRHVAAKTAALPDLVRAIFTLRLLLSCAVALLWLSAVAIVPAAIETKLVWALGAPFLVVIAVNYSWYFLATDRTARYSLVQLAASLTVSLSYLGLFHPNQRAGSDLAVFVVVNGVIAAVVWMHIRRACQCGLFDIGKLDHAWKLLVEGRPNWLFALGYFSLSSLNLPLIYMLLGDHPAGLYRSAAILANTLQLFLAYVGYTLAPRIVEWRARDAALMRHRVLWVATALCIAGLAAFGILAVLHRTVFQLCFGQQYLDGSPLLPVLVLGKFLATASGVLVWALYACQRDWLAVKCCLPPLAAGLLLNFVLLPTHGVAASAWLNGLAELALFAGCLGVFLRLKLEPSKPA